MYSFSINRSRCTFSPNFSWSFSCIWNYNETIDVSVFASFQTLSTASSISVSTITVNPQIICMYAQIIHVPQLSTYLINMYHMCFNHIHLYVRPKWFKTKYSLLQNVELAHGETVVENNVTVERAGIYVTTSTAIVHLGVHLAIVVSAATQVGEYTWIVTNIACMTFIFRYSFPPWSWTKVEIRTKRDCHWNSYKLLGISCKTRLIYGHILPNWK